MSSSPPRPAADEAAARRLVLILGLVAVVLVGVMWIVFRPENLGSSQPSVPPSTRPSHPPTQAPTRAVPSTPAAVPSPEPAPGNWELPPRHWEPVAVPPTLSPQWAVLGGNQINDASALVLSGCPEPSLVETMEDYEYQVRAQWDCLHASFIPLFEEFGVSTLAPDLVFYTGIGSRSECGWIEAPAFYCSSGEGTGYFGTEHFEMTKAWDLSVNEMVNHEYGHHVQKVMGITAAKLQVAPAPDIERRAELQAICWSGMLTYHSDAVDFGQAEFEGWIARVDAMIASDVHGTRASLEHWGMRGLWATSFSDCNTWLAEEDQVS